MLSSDGHPGLLAFILGLILVVCAGIVLSMAVDRRFNFSTLVVEIEKEIRNNDSELEGLRRTHRERSWSLTELEPKRKMNDAALADFRKRAIDMGRRRKALIGERESLRDSIPVIEDEFVRYRLKYREAARDAAIGEFLGTLAIPGGHEYREAFITRVTDVGLEIRHAHGYARISAVELGSAFQDRFQWDDKERRARLGEELVHQKAMERMPEAAQRPETPHPARDEARPDFQKIRMLRSKVIAWRTKVSQLHVEKSKALSASYGSQASPPGSLETWQGRAARLGGEIARAEAELAAAKAALALVAPDDALLQTPYAGY